MRKFLKRYFGRILVDAGFVSRPMLASALQEQRKTKELLGEVLVRRGALQPGEVKASLLLQNYLLKIEDAASLAVGERQMLGSLLMESGRISQEDLDRAIAEQGRSGGKLGEILVRLGLVSQEQLKALLSFQANQEANTSGPFRLGELLVTTGDLSRQQLDAALVKKNGSAKKLGEVPAKEKPQKGKIIAVGEGLKDKPVTVKVGDNVLYGKYAGTEISIDGKEYLIMRNSDIFGII